MASFQVVSLKPMEGISKASQRPYKMLIVAGLYTNDDGTVEMGEAVFMERTGHPLPTHLQLGQKYTPTVGASSRQGKLQFEITALTPVVAAKVAAAA